MNIVCLSNLGVSTEYVVRQLFAQLDNVHLVAVPFAVRPKAKKRRPVLRILKRACRRMEESWFYHPRLVRAEEQLRQLLYGDATLPPLPRSLVIPSNLINSPESEKQIHSLRPDVLVTVGAPLLKPQIFQIPPLGSMNLHFGISPWYRGEDTLFWPLFYRDWRRVGVTIHQIDAGIDTGEILAQGFLDVKRDDTEWTLEARAAQLGAGLLIERLRQHRAMRLSNFSERTSAGRQFNYSARHVWHDATVLWQRWWYRPSAC